MRLFTGQRAWLLQRITALAMLILVGSGAAALLFGGPLGYREWHALATGRYGAAAIVVFFAFLSVHGWIGVRDIVLDYVHRPAARVGLLALVAALLFAVWVRVVLVLAASSVITG